jgi:tRNA (guanine10-N2)-dimethyltransferase
LNRIIIHSVYREWIGILIPTHRYGSGVYVLELGGQDDPFARREAESAASGVSTLAPGLVTASDISGRVRHLAYTRRACEVIGTSEPDIDSARSTLADTTFDRNGSIAVRAVDVRGTTGIDTQHAEHELGDILTDRGFTVDLTDPDQTLYAYFSDPAGDTTGGTGKACCVLGWFTIESQRDFGQRQPTDRPFFKPGSMDPLEARALVNIAGARPGATIIDPMCGTGGLLIEAGLVGARVIGSDAQEPMVHGTRRNLRDAFTEGDRSETPNWGVCRADAARLPMADGVADAVVFDAPYGRQSPIEGELHPLVSSALTEARRIATRCVLVADREWSDVAREAGWTVTDRFERRVHRSLVRHIHVLR